MNKKSRQHWVPQFYLRAFASHSDGKNPTVWAFAREGEGDPFQAAVKRIGAEKGLYPSRVDARLRELEDLLGAVWLTVADRFLDLTSEPLRKALSLFIATLHLRNPARIPEYASLHANLVALFDTMPKDALGRPMAAQVEAGGRVHDFDTSGWEAYKAWTDSDHRAFFASALGGEAGGIARLLLPKRWAVVVDEGGGFATSDSPVCLWHPRRERLGFRTPGAMVSLPLSPTRFLIVDDGPGEQGYFDSKPGFVEAMNYQTWSAAYRFLITRAPTDSVLEGIVRFAEEAGLS